MAVEDEEMAMLCCQTVIYELLSSIVVNKEIPNN